MPKTKEPAADRQRRTEAKADNRVSASITSPRFMFETKPVTAQRVRGIRGDAGDGTYAEAVERGNKRFFNIKPSPGPVSDVPSRKRNR